MLADYINFGECFAQPISISLALFVGRASVARVADPVQDPQPGVCDDIVQVIERSGEEAAMTPSSVQHCARRHAHRFLVPLTTKSTSWPR
jgi:hypothetical protein